MAESKNSSESMLPEWAFVHKPLGSGRIKVNAEDFMVEEVLGFEPDGHGEHIWLFIEKKGFNTQTIVNMLAAKLKLPASQISYSGLKDKHAITRQWFSINTPKDIDLGKSLPVGVHIVDLKRHGTKLRRGVHQSNRFEIVLRDVLKPPEIKEAIARIQRCGVPNYFGPQRFGHGGKNIERARALFQSGQKPKRHQRGLYLSAARAFLFNSVLSQRVEDQNWDTGLVGDAMMLAGSNSFFSSLSIDDTLVERLLAHDIHPSAPLWGKGALASSGEALVLESAVAAQHADLVAGLSRFGLRQQRRAMRLVVEDLEYEWMTPRQLKLNFRLAKGAFATTVLRELITIRAHESDF